MKFFNPSKANTGSEPALQWRTIPDMRSKRQRTTSEVNAILASLEVPRTNAQIVFYLEDKRYEGVFLGATMPLKASWRITAPRLGTQAVAVSRIEKWAYADGS